MLALKWGLPRGLGILVLVGASAFPRAQDLGQDHGQQYEPADVAIGLRVYTASCVPCHGPNGDGVGTVNLRRGPLPRATTDAALRDLITNGIPASGMPALRLSTADLTGLVAFIRVGFNTSVAPVAMGNPQRGQAIFSGKGQCLSCHRVNGVGRFVGPDLSEVGSARSPAAITRSLEDPTSAMLPINRPVRAVMRDGRTLTGRRLNEDSYTVQIITDQGRLLSLLKAELREWTVGARSPMPSFRETLTAEERADLVGYLVSLKVAR